MAYKKRSNYSKKLAKMREAKERKRLEQGAPDYPPLLPNLRRKIIIIDYDFGEVRHEINLYKTNRIDQYKAIADGKPWKDRIGWSKILEGLRKSLIRVNSTRNL